MSAMSGSRAKKGDPLAKRIPENPKYKHVKATVDSGASINRYMQKIEDIRQNYKFRKDEIFKRMKVTTFIQLLVQVIRVAEDENNSVLPPGTPATDRPGTGDVEIQKIQGRTSPVPSLALTDGDFGGNPSEPDTSRSTLLSVAHGVGELDLNAPPPPPPNRFVDAECPYLILDVREDDAYEMCHIITAHSYPKAYLSRATNYEIKEMLAYKNQPGKIIVLYDEDERIAPLACTTLVERGYDNLFMLSGGLKVATKLFPEGLVTGTLPPSLLHGSAKSIVPADQKLFCTEDIDRLEIYLDNALQDHSIGSRLSKAGSNTSRMSGRSTAQSTASKSSSVGNRPPFR